MNGDENLRHQKGAAGDNRTAEIDGGGSISEILDGDEEEELIGIEEETITEVMRWLEREIRSPPPIPPAITGNQESCGPSISDSASTVMADVDTSAGGGGLSFFFGAPAGLGFQAAGIRAWIGGSDVNQEADGGGGGADEEWMARVLSEDGVELEESLFLG